MAQASQASRGTHESPAWGPLGFWLGRVLILVFLAIGLVFTIYPFLFMLSSSLKTNAEIFSAPPTLIPPTWQFGNWVSLFTDTAFAMWFRNSLIDVSVRTDLGLSWDKAMATATLSITPLVLMFLLAQKQFIAGLTTGGVKGV